MSDQPSAEERAAKESICSHVQCDRAEVCHYWWECKMGRAREIRAAEQAAAERVLLKLAYVKGFRGVFLERLNSIEAWSEFFVWQISLQQDEMQAAADAREAKVRAELALELERLDKCERDLMNFRIEGSHDAAIREELERNDRAVIEAAEAWRRDPCTLTANALLEAVDALRAAKRLASDTRLTRSADRSGNHG